MRAILAYDIGGTNARAAWVVTRPDGSTDVVGARSQPLPASGSIEEIRLALRTLTDKVRTAAVASAEAIGVGVACPGPTDYRTGTLWLEHKLAALRGQSLTPWVRLPGRPLAFVNDAEAFGRGALGARASNARVLAVTLGTGVGSALFDAGQVVAHEPLWSAPLPDGSGQTVEGRLGRDALLSTARARGLRCETLAQLAQDGGADDFWSELGETLADVLVDVARRLGVTQVILGGGVSGAFARFSPAMNARLRTHGSSLSIATSPESDHAALRGAALALEQRLTTFRQRRVVYLHGFLSAPSSSKAQRFVEMLRAKHLHVELPDLNAPRFADLTITRQLEQLDRLASGAAPGELLLIGSSLGGYVGALFAARDPRVAALVLLAPAFEFATRFAARLGGDELARWERNGQLELLHYAFAQTLPLSWRFFEDARRYEPYPDVRQPVLVLQGERDEVVDPQLARRFAEGRPNVALHVIHDGDHQLGPPHLDEVLARSWEFLGPFCA